MSKLTMHIVSHTHWDREWYMPYESHHVRLVEYMDALLAIFDRDPDFKSFFLDGQTIVMEDYLQVRPEKRDRIVELMQEGRLAAGPWYILQDEFLTSSEANVRNLQVGHQDMLAYGPVAKLGYFPDSFGNMGQAPQLMNQAGITNAIFGRGVKATGFNNSIEDTLPLESPFSEMYWESPDGSRVLGILFANWYNNGMEIPSEREAARRFWDNAIPNAQRYASTSQLLFMNGCDHQPPQADLSLALDIARELYPEYTFIHSTLEDYVKAVSAELPESLSTVIGELRGQRTDGLFTLVNTASARVYIKQLNQQGQTALEKIAEPLAALAQAEGRAYPHSLLTYAWKTLMQNHPHDSICGCSVDEVYEEMKTRFAKSAQVAKEITASSAQHIANKIDTSSFRSEKGAHIAPFAVFNTSGYGGSSVVTGELELFRQYFGGMAPEETARMVREASTAAGMLIDSDGNAIAHTVEDLGVQFGYDLPDDKFRQPYYARKIRVSFEAANLPALGYRTYAWAAGEASATGTASAATAPALASLADAAANTLENDYLRIAIQPNGTLSVTDKLTGQQYEGLGAYENVGDIGNEYIFKQPNGDVALTTEGLQADISLVEDTPQRAAFEIVLTWEIPAAADSQLEAEVQAMVPFLKRQAQRGSATVPFIIRTTVSLERSGRGAQVRAAFNNQAKDHRLRVLFPAGVQATVHHADSIFEVAERNTTPEPEWINPSNCQHQSAFIDVHQPGRGLTIANKGLNEYEVLQDGNSTIAVTLLRSVGELGDWGVFLTPGAQCLGDNEAEWMIIPHAGNAARFAAYQEAYRYQIPVTVSQAPLQEGELALTMNYLDWSGRELAFSNLKCNPDNGDWIARWYNLAAAPATLATAAPNASSAYASDVLEQQHDTLGELGEGRTLSVPVSPKQIISIGFTQ